MEELIGKTIKYIPEDAVVNIQVSGAFYKRLYQLSRFLIKEIGDKRFKQVMKEINADKIESTDTFNLETVNMIMLAISDIADKEGKLKEHEFTADDIKELLAQENT